MPRARPKQGDPSVILQVSPWHTKPKHQKSQEDEATVIIEPLIKTSPSSQKDRSTSEKPPQRSSPPPTHQVGYHPAQVGEWHSIHHHIDDTTTAASKTKIRLDENKETIDAAIIGKRANNRDQVNNNNDKATSASKSLNLTGTAFLAVLEDASITGHLIVLDDITNSKTNYGIMGREVVSFRECTRDPDWAVVRLTLINFRTGEEMTFLVEKSGGDAMSLVAPVSWQGLEEEEEMQGELSKGCIRRVEGWFSCEHLLTGDAADNVLMTMKKEELCGRVVVVNQGEFSVCIPSSINGAGEGGGRGGDREEEEEEEEEEEAMVIVRKRKGDDDDDWL